MVLIYCIILLLQANGDSLTSKYEKEASEVITASLEVSEFTLEKASFSRGELHRVHASGKFKGYLLIAEVAACNLGGCPAYDQIKADRSSEYFDLLVLTDANQNILSVKVLDYFSDYGYEITSKRYLKRFKGKPICAFARDTDDVDIVSGATISSFALEGMISLLCVQLSEGFSNIDSLSN